MKRLKQTLSLILASLLLLGLFAVPAQADGDMIVGEVTITARTSVNLRTGGSTQYPIIGTAMPGQLFQTTGQVASGWYEILLPDGSFAYVSNNLVLFVPYASPIPIGGGFLIPVYYRTSSGQALRSMNVSVRVGQNLITADDSLVPGYRLISTRNVYVNVSASGTASPSGVIFTYEPIVPIVTPAPVQTYNLPVYYRDINNQIIASESRSLVKGAQLVRADSSRLPSGYYLSGATDAVVVVSSTGTISPAAVNFLVSRSISPTAVPSVQVPISYRDEQGNVLYSTSQTLQPGYSTITADDTKAGAGMSLISTRSVVVYVSNQGYASPSGVVFTYRASALANVQVIYQDQNGRNLYSEVRTLGYGSTRITADDSRVGTGYVLQSSRTVTVNVDRNGRANPSLVVFTYALPVRVSINVLYQDPQGRYLHGETLSLSQGTTTISAVDSKVPAGYVLQGNRSVQVTVYSNGSVSQNQVVFTYSKPVTAQIEVIYTDRAGTRLHSEYVTLSQGTTTISANDRNVPSGYTLQGNRQVQVTLYANGNLSQRQVVFTYSLPVSARLEIIYTDRSGTRLHSEVVTLPQGVNTISANDRNVPSGYTLQGARHVQVTVYPNGNLSHGQVVFVYSLPIQVSIEIIYKDRDGNVFHRESQTIGAGTSTFSANDNRAPAGYVLRSNRNVQVSVAANGTATPSQVEFIYTPPATGSVNVIYKDGAGNEWSNEMVSLPEGNNTLRADDSKMPPNYTLHSAREVRVNINANGQASPAQVVHTYYMVQEPGPTAAPQPGTQVPLLPDYTTFSYSGQDIPVHSGPGDQYYRSGNGRATLGGGRIRIWGEVDNWLMIGYGLSNNLYRIGYVHKGYLPANLNVASLQLADIPAVIVTNAPLNDDPIINPIPIFDVPAGTEVRLLAYDNWRNSWAYIETTYNGEAIRGFVRKERVQIQ